MDSLHPYLDQNENPCAATYRLLQLVNYHMQEKGAFDLNEAQLAEAITYQANQAHEIIIAGMAALQPLLPCPSIPIFQACLLTSTTKPMQPNCLRKLIKG
jgi:hypothetical protein